MYNMSLSPPSSCPSRAHRYRCFLPRYLPSAPYLKFDYARAICLLVDLVRLHPAHRSRHAPAPPHYFSSRNVASSCPLDSPLRFLPHRPPHSRRSRQTWSRHSPHLILQGDLALFPLRAEADPCVYLRVLEIIAHFGPFWRAMARISSTDCFWAQHRLVGSHLGQRGERHGLLDGKVRPDR
jgi:hypothetical protein